MKDDIGGHHHTLRLESTRFLTQIASFTSQPRAQAAPSSSTNAANAASSPS